jgi:hypothetical protein
MNEEQDEAWEKPNDTGPEAIDFDFDFDKEEGCSPSHRNPNRNRYQLEMATVYQQAAPA